ncbi:MAG: hypothetical protein ABJN22_05665 [Litorimonas sp.]
MSLKKLALVGGMTASLMAGTAYASVIDRPFFQVLGVVVVYGADGNTATSNAPVVSDFVLLTTGSNNAGADLIGGTAQDTFTVLTGSLSPIVAGEAGSATFTDPITGAVTATGFADDGTTAGVLDAGDSLSAFEIDGSTDVDGLVNQHRSSFYVASNAAFDIYATADNLSGTGDFDPSVPANNIGYEDISLSMEVKLSPDAGDTDTFWGSNNQSPGAVEAAFAAGEGLDALRADLVNGVKVFDGTARTAASPGSLTDQSVRFDNTYSFGDGTGYDLSMGAGSLTADVTYTIFVP